MDAASYSIDETAALNFLSGLGFREGTGGQLKCRKAVDEEDIVLEGDIRIGIRAEEQRYSKEGLIMDEHIIIDQKPTTPQYVDSQHSRWSAFSNLTHLGFFHKRRNEPSRLFTGSASTLRDDALMPSPSSAKRMLDPSRLWTRQAKRSAQDRKAGISFADLLVPSISPLFPPTPHNDGEPRGSVRRNIEEIKKIGNILTTSSNEYVIHLKKTTKSGFLVQENPWVHSTITLSKLRNLKSDLFKLIVKMPELDPSTVAMAWTYFERLVARQVVHKTTRKQLAGACLVLAFKFNQALRATKLGQLTQVIKTLDRKDHLTPHDIFAAEFRVFAMIEFGMQLTFSDIAPHLMEYFERSEGKSFQSEYGITPEEFMRRETIPVTPQRASFANLNILV